MDARFDCGREGRAMHLSDAKGYPLLHDGDLFGADIIEFPPNGSIGMHTHPGAHFLFCLSGSGVVNRDGQEITLKPGVCYLIPTMIPHSVCASENGLRLLVVGNNHRPVDSSERMSPC